MCTVKINLLFNKHRTKIDKSFLSFKLQILNFSVLSNCHNFTRESEMIS